MAFFDKVQDFVKSATDKTSEVIEVSKLKNAIAEEKRAINEQYVKLGAMLYEKYKAGESLSPEEVNICVVVDKHNNRIAEKEAELKKIADANAEKKAAKAQSTADVECPECHSKNTAGTKFCSNCGAKIPEIIEAEAVVVEESKKKYCSNCGAEVSEGKNFCTECGQKVE